MENVTVIEVDLAKSVFQLHGAAADGSVVFRKELSRRQFQLFMERHPRCRVAMEACASARLCCTNPVRDSSFESNAVAGMHEQTDIPDLQDQELASLQ